MKDLENISPDFISKKYVQLLEKSNLDLHQKTNPFSYKNLFVYTALFSTIIAIIGFVYLYKPQNDVFKDHLIKTAYNNKFILIETQEGEFYQITKNTNKKWLANNGVFINVNNEQISFTNTESASNKSQTNYTLWIPENKQYNLINADGTKIQLNSNSKLLFSNIRNTTTNAILNGEAYFKIAHNPEQAFSIKASEMNIEVYGTEFNIANYQKRNTTSLSLVSGSVKVGSTSNKSIFIKPGEQVILNKDNVLNIGIADFSNTLAWKNNQLYFKNEKLETITKKVSDWYKVNFSFNNNSIRHIPFTGTLNKDNSLVHFLEMLKYTEGIDYKIKDNIVILSKRKQLINQI